MESLCHGCGWRTWGGGGGGWSPLLDLPPPRSSDSQCSAAGSCVQYLSLFPPSPAFALTHSLTSKTGAPNPWTCLQARKRHSDSDERWSSEAGETCRARADPGCPWQSRMAGNPTEPPGMASHASRPSSNSAPWLRCGRGPLRGHSRSGRQGAKRAEAAGPASGLSGGLSRRPAAPGAKPPFSSRWRAQHPEGLGAVAL